MTISRQGNLKQSNKNQEAPRPHREREGGVTGALRRRDVASVPKPKVAVPFLKSAVPKTESALTPALEPCKSSAQQLAPGGPRPIAAAVVGCNGREGPRPSPCFKSAKRAAVHIRRASGARE